MAEIRSAYDALRRPVLATSGESRTQKHFKDDCDINNIVARYVNTGYLPPANGRPIYADVSAVGTYTEALAQIHQGRLDFEQLPSDVRRSFENDPIRYIDYCLSHSDSEVSLALGLVRRISPTPAQTPEKTQEKSLAGTPPVTPT